MTVADSNLFRIEPHVCAICFGRILSRDGGENGRVYRCACCGEERQGASVRVLCSCGMKLRARSAGVRCAENPRRSPEFPFEIVAEQL
jgi:hypothetical protein